MNKEQLNIDFLEAASKCDIKEVQRLLDAGADVNYIGRSNYPALHHAVYYGKKDIVRTLLDAGANIIYEGILDHTALHYAISSDNKDILDMLLKAARTKIPTLQEITARYIVTNDPTSLLEKAAKVREARREVREKAGGPGWSDGSMSDALKDGLAKKLWQNAIDSSTIRER